jgi:hypothetical protein
VFDVRVLKKILGQKREKVAEDGRKLQCEKFIIYTLPKIFFRVFTSRRIRLVDHVARKGERIGAYDVLVGKPEGRNHLEILDIDGRIILKWIFIK